MVNLIWHARCVEHQPPDGHPERPDRGRVMATVVERWRDRCVVLEPRSVTKAEAARVHAVEYLDRLAGITGIMTMLDPDTHTSATSVEIAHIAAGAACVAVEQVLAGATGSLALVRPPGHHAERDRAMGFCLLNNVAIGAAHARARGCRRVAIVDIDVHHGNGTQHIFDADPSVLFVSMHQSPHYPGTGATSEIGLAEGRGFTVNLPLTAGATDADYDCVVREYVVPVLEAFAPEMLLVSAGFDLHRQDPLGDMDVSTDGVRAILARLVDAAQRTCDGRIAVVTEGGYDRDALEACLDATVEVLSGGQAPRLLTSIAGDTSRAQRVLRDVRAAHRTTWPTL